VPLANGAVSAAADQERRVPVHRQHARCNGKHRENVSATNRNSEAERAQGGLEACIQAQRAQPQLTTRNQLAHSPSCFMSAFL
jgi:hypothetical protein